MTSLMVQPRMHQNSRTGKLTPSTIANFKPLRYARKISDGDGLYLLVTPKGGRCWRYAYRMAGKQKTLALGQYPDLPLEKARLRHEFARYLLTNGIDPSLLKRVLGKHAFSIAARECAFQQYPQLDRKSA